MSESKDLVKLNVGCGGQVLPGYINLDKVDYPHTHIKYDLEDGVQMYFKTGEIVPDNYFDRILISHTFEHVTNILQMMTELWRVAKPGCSCVVITPYGSSDNADEDPTHVRRIFKDTYHYFSQAWYGKNSYEYGGDWEYIRRIFVINSEYRNLNEVDLGRAVAVYRNVVSEFHAELRAIKPRRESGFVPHEASTAFKFL